MDCYGRQNSCYLLIFSCLLFCTCRRVQPEITRSYYFWRNNSYIRTEETKFLSEHHIHKLYAKLFDVDWSDVYGAIPVSQDNLDEVNRTVNIYDSLKVQIVPVIFITNKTFERIDTTQISVLAKRIIRRCLPAYDSLDVQYEKERYNYGNYFDNRQYKLIPRPNEIQFDCDWTVTTSGNYFSFLKAVRSLLPDSVKVSATIRLHQYKYPSKTGVPPVNRGMLMMYNITDPKKYTNTNSIFDYDKANAYFTSDKKYPLPLDIVLPAYSWSLVFRNSQFLQVENNLSENELKTLSFLQKENNGFYRVTADTVYQDIYLRIGDEVKPEGISEDVLEQAARLSQKAVNNPDFTVALFELSEDEIKNYHYEKIENLYNSYHTSY